MKKILLFALLVVAFGVGVYIFDYQKKAMEQERKVTESKIINFNCDQINHIEVKQDKDEIVLQKSETGWSILEPIQDIADNDYVESTLKTLCDEKYLAVAKEALPGEKLNLSEYGLENPISVITIKNNLNETKKIQIGSQKNFEGNSFIRLDSENKVLVATPNWLTKANEKLISFRKKNLYRGLLVDVDKVIVTSLHSQYEIERKDGKWILPKFPEAILDQAKVRETLKKISDASIQDYLVEGEPSQKILKEKSLIKPAVKIEFVTEKGKWSVAMNLDPKDKTLNAVTERPTNLIKLDISNWEFFGNLSLDSMRDRATVLRFDLDKVCKIYLKVGKTEVTYIKDKLSWKKQDNAEAEQKLSAAQISKVLNKIHDLEISEFIDKKSVPEFKGSNMIILKTESDNLVYQLNWGPEVKLPTKNLEKLYVLARTQVDPMIFALDEDKINELGIYELLGMQTPEKNPHPITLSIPKLDSPIPLKPKVIKPVQPAPTPTSESAPVSEPAPMTTEGNQ